MRAPLTFVTLLFSCAHAAAQEAERPNVIVIVSDDQGWADIGTAA